MQRRLISSLLILSLLLSNVSYAEDLTATQQDYDIAGISHSMPLSLEVEALQFSVSVPTELPCYVHANGTVDVANNAIIKNNGNNTIQVKEIAVTPKTGWSIKPYNSELSQNQFGLRINEKLSTEGSFTWNKFKVEQEQEVPVVYDIKIGKYEQGLEYTSIADITMVLDWYEVDPYLQVTGDTLYDGSTMVQLGEVLQLETPTTYSMRSTNTWSSSDETKATIDENGIVTPIEPGRVTFSYGDLEVPIHVYGEPKAISASDMNMSTSTITIPDHYYKDGVWYTVTSIANEGFSTTALNNKSVIVSDTIVSIGDYAFTGNPKSVKLPESLQYMGVGIFKGCNNLITVNLPSSITHIPDYTFYKTSIGSFVPHDGIVSIGEYAFGDISNMGTIVIPKNCAYVGSYAFYGCSKATKVYVYGPLTKLNPYTLPWKQLVCYFPRTLTHIGSDNLWSQAFDGCTINYEGSAGEWQMVTSEGGTNKATIYYNSDYRTKPPT